MSMFDYAGSVKIVPMLRVLTANEWHSAEGFSGQTQEENTKREELERTEGEANDRGDKKTVH
eukprot:gene17063-18781_t